VTRLACGIDVGGTKIAGGVVDEQGTILEELRVESPATDASAIEQAIEGLVGELRSRHDIEAVGVGAAGYIDKARAVVMFAPNLAWRDLDLKVDLEAKLDIPVVVENDANAAAWGEFQFGAGHDVDDLLLVTVGTGVGGGFVLDGALFRGAFGVGAEIGHMRVVPDGILCGCGNRGCLEMYASGSALVREARAAAHAGSLLAADLVDRAGGDPDDITGPLITDAARAGDPFAVEHLTRLGQWLGEGIASLTAVLDPAVVVVGGGVSAADDLLLDPTRRAFAAQLTGRGHRPMLEIRKATLGNRAGLIGAADLTRY
jgi:glucokinase